MIIFALAIKGKSPMMSSLKIRHYYNNITFGNVVIEKIQHLLIFCYTSLNFQSSCEGLENKRSISNFQYYFLKSFFYRYKVKLTN